MSKRLSLWLVLVVLLIGGRWPAAALDVSNPYIYYFSDKLNAFIVERADGTDTRVLGAGLMDDPADAGVYVDGPGWSPSGEWFAWTAQPAWMQPRQYINRPYAIRANGTQRLTVLDNFKDARLAWAGDRDVLLMVARDFEAVPRADFAAVLAADYDPPTVEQFIAAVEARDQNREQPVETFYLVYTHLMAVDAAQDRIVSSVTVRTITDYYVDLRDIPAALPTADHDHLMIRYRDECAYFVRDCGTAHFLSVDADGVIADHVFDTPSDIVSISPAGWVASATEDSFQIENVLTGQQHQFVPVNSPDQIVWDDSGQYAMVVNEQVWWLDCPAAQMYPLRENWTVADFYPRIGRPIWSPDSGYALLRGADDTLGVFNRANGSFSTLPLAAGAQADFVGWYWSDTTQVGLYYPGQFIIYDLTTLTAHDINADIGENTAARLAPDGQHLAFVANGPIVYDLVTGAYQQSRPSYAGFQTFWGGEVDWHPAGDWLLIYEEALIAGGGYQRNFGVMRADGATRRDLGYLDRLPTPLTLDWLPPQVDPADLPPPITEPLFPQPAITLHGAHWSFYVAWSPDGRWLAAGLDWGRGANNIDIWAVDTAQITQSFAGVGSAERVRWSAGEPVTAELYVPEPTGDGEYVISAYSPDGRHVIQNNRVIDTLTGQVVTELDIRGGFYSFAAFSPDGAWLASSDVFDGVRIWDTTTWTVVATLPNPGQAVAWSPDGTLLAVAASWEVQIWDMADLLAFAQP